MHMYIRVDFLEPVQFRVPHPEEDLFIVKGVLVVIPGECAHKLVQSVVGGLTLDVP